MGTILKMGPIGCYRGGRVVCHTLRTMRRIILNAATSVWAREVKSNSMEECRIEKIMQTPA
jgi:hypothetical protein